MSIRSMLYAPGNQERKVGRAMGSGADAVMFDLEDAVPMSEKGAARVLVKSAISEGQRPPRGIKVAVRINPWQSGAAELDLEACVWQGLDLIKVPKFANALTLAQVDGALTYLESQRGIAAGTVRIMPEVDSPRDVLNLEQIASASCRIDVFQMGGGQDYANDLGVEVSDGMVESKWARQYAVLVAHKLGMEPPMHGSVGYSKDPDAIARRERILRTARQWGYQGATCLHPDQIEMTNEIFSIPQSRLDWAARVVEEYSTASESGNGTVMIDGRFVDEAHYRGAMALLEQHSSRK